MTKILGYLAVSSSTGRPWVDADGRALMFTDPDDAQAFASGVYPVTGTILPVVRYRPSRKPRHEYGTNHSDRPATSRESGQQTPERTPKPDRNQSRSSPPPPWKSRP